MKASLFARVTWLILMLLCMAPDPVQAVIANPNPVELQQPDGTKITLRIRGDEHFSWFEDADGYTVVLSQGTYVYAVLDGNDLLAPTSFAVGAVDPQTVGIEKGVLPSSITRRQLRYGAIRTAQALPAGAPQMIVPNGVVKNLVILCKFSDHTFGTHTRDRDDYDTVFNAAGGDATLAPTGSVKDYFHEASYGTMTLNSVVVAWVTLPHTEAYYANGSKGFDGAFPNNSQGMVRDALALVDPLVNFGDFDSDNDGYVDAIDIIHSGYGAETGGGGGNWIWSHRWALWQAPGGKWTSADRNGNNANVSVRDYHTEPALWGTSGNQISRIGVICHETGHFFGLPDLYDSDSSSSGLGSFCLMANSWGFDGTQLHPPHLSAWCKKELGWVIPTVISPGTLTLPQVGNNPTVFRIDAGYPSGEYLLIENRQKFGFENNLPQGGLAIWHIDENRPDNKSEGFPGQTGWPANDNHYKVSLLQADGRYDLEKSVNSGDAGDLFHGAGVSSIGPDTVPNTHAYRNGTILPTGNRISAISASGVNITFTYARSTGVTVPTITAFAPTSGGVGANVVIDGTGLNGVTSVEFNGVNAAYVNISASQISATVPGGATTGVIRVTTAGGTATSAAVFTVTSTGPANNHFANAGSLTGSSGSVSGSNVGATKETGEPSHAGNAGGSSIWYNWTAPGSGSATIDTIGSAFDTTLAVYNGSTVSTLTTVASNDDSDGSTRASRLTFAAVAGTVYRIAVDGYDGASGNITLNWTLTTTSTGPTITSFTPTSGAAGATVTITGTGFTGATAVRFNGISATFTINSPTQITTPVPATATSGPISVTTADGTATSSTAFTVTGPTGPANDNFASAQAITGASGTVNGSNVGARKEANEPDHAGNPGGKSIWYSWMATGTGSATFDTDGSSFDTVLAIYTGASLTGLTLIGSNDDIFGGSGSQSSVTIQSIAGTVYRIAVDGYSGASGNVVLTWRYNANTPSIASFSPATAAVGANITIVGTNLTGATSVQFNGTSAVFTVDSATQITATVPSGAASGTISVVTPGGTAVSTATFTLSTGFNDNFANSQLIGDSGSITGRNTGATLEFGEPNHPGWVGGHSIWYRWTAPTSGSATFDTIGSAFDTVLGVYTGTVVSALTEIVSNDDIDGTNLLSQVTFNAVEGTVYRIAVDGFNTSDFGDVTLNWSIGPSNDIFENARTLAGNAGSVTGGNLGGTQEIGEPLHPANDGGRSIWYAWTAPGAGLATIDTMGSSFDTILAVYTGSSVSTLSLVASNDDSSTNTQSTVTFSAVAGTTYRIMVDGFDAAEGNVTLNWALESVGLPTITSFSPTSGPPGTTVVITGANLASATSVRFNGVNALFSANSAAQITATVPAGASSGVLAVTTAGGTVSSAASFTVLGGAANNNFANAQVLTGAAGTVSGNNIGADKEASEPNHAGNPGGKSIWYAWTAPAAGAATIDSIGSSFDTVLAVYTGTSLASLTEVASNDDIPPNTESRVTFTAVAGTVYRIAVDGFSAASGNMILNRTMSASVSPTLVVGRQASEFKVSWPATFAGFVLETTTTVETNWTAVSPQPTGANGEFAFTNSTPAPKRFYRLRKP